MARTPPVIALVDDNPAHLELLHDILSDAGYRTLPLRSGGPYTEARLSAGPLDLLIVDLRLESRDGGLGLVERLRRLEARRRLPVLICSADHALMREQAERLRHLGCAVLEKPFDLDDLLATVATLLGHRVDAAPGHGRPGQR